MLTHIHTVTLAKDIIIAKAHVAMPDEHSKQAIKKAQQAAVRALLRQVMTADKRFDCYVLNESCHPFCLSHFALPKYYVSFSHSCCQHGLAHLSVALVIARTPCGIDVECGAVSVAVAKRFFHANELMALAVMNETTRQCLIKRLWQLKEAWIKAKQSTLAVGMGVDFSPLLTQLGQVGNHALPFGRLYVDETVVALVL